MVHVSIVIPTYNRLNQLKNILQALEAQSFPLSNFEVIVVSDGSKDGTNEYLSGLSTALNLRPIIQENSGAATARNKGAQGATGAIILFLDDDVLPDVDLVRKHVLDHEKLSLTDIVLGTMLTPRDWPLLPWVAWEQNMLERQYRRMIKGVYKASSRQFFTGNASLKREFFFINGCFDPKFRRAEDVEFAYRADKLGANFHFDPEAKGYHYAQRSFESWMQTAYVYGTNDVTFTYEKGVNWLLPKIFKEYKTRNILFRAILPFFLDAKKRQAIFLRLLKAIGTETYQHHLPVISRFAFSTIFNMQYYQGIADKLGGRTIFFSHLNHKA